MEGLVVEVSVDGLGAGVRLLTSGLYLGRRELETVVALVPQLKGEGVGDADQSRPITGRARVLVWQREREGEGWKRNSFFLLANSVRNPVL